MNKKKEAWDADSWKELQDLITLDEVKKALKARETQRLAHKRYSLKKQATLERIAELRARDPELDKKFKALEASV